MNVDEKRLHRIGIIASVLAVSFAPTACLAEEITPVSKLFKRVVESEGTNYVQAREEFLKQGDVIKPFLKQLNQSQDWCENLEAKILSGWIENPSLYPELWNWHAPENMMRNPFPAYKEGARQKFSDAGTSAIPVMVELVWKKGDLQLGALPELLAEGKVMYALPVLVRSKSGVPKVMGLFGGNATEQILEVLPTAQREHKSWLVEALGFTGGTNAVAELIGVLKNETELFGREAATALGNLGQFAVLRDEYFRVKPVEVRLAMLQGLAKDKSAETRRHLLAVATAAPRLNHSPYGDERLAAFQAVMTDATPEDVSIVCELYAPEPDEHTRWCIIACLLHDSKYPLVVETLLKGLKDRSPLVRAAAIEGLKYNNGNEVTTGLLAIYRNDEDEGCRVAAIQILMDRTSSLIGEAAMARLEDKDPCVQRFSIYALGKNPVPGAVSRLTRLLSSTNSNCRASAAMAMGNIGGKAVLKSLEAAELLEKEDAVRRMIHSAIQTAKYAERTDKQVPR